MSARKKRSRSVGWFLKFALAACSILGIGVALTTAAWTDDVAFTGGTSVAPFQMQYSFTNSAGSWIAFPAGTATVTLSNIPGWMSPNTATATHSIFVRNVGATSTQIQVEPLRTGVFTDTSVLEVRTGLSNGAMTTLPSGVATVTVSGEQVARVDLVITPSALSPAAYERTGTIEVRVTGTVGAPSTFDEWRTRPGRLDTPFVVGADRER